MNKKLKTKEVQHMVIFNLPYPINSKEAMLFLSESTAVLSVIPGVNGFQAVRQTSAKNKYKYAFSMRFDSQNAYNAYNNHAAHISYVNDMWNTTVTEFLEIDYEAFEE